MKNVKYDYGYGVNGNPSYYIVLNEIMDKESSKVFREELKSEDKKKYEEYLDYEKRMDNFKKRRKKVNG